MNNEEININRPKGFTFLAAYLAYIAFIGIAKGLHFASVYGSIPALLGFFYGLSAMVAAYSLWFFRPWAFHATTVHSISVLLWLFNYQYWLNDKYTLPLHFFVLYVIFICLLFVLLLYYIKKKLREADK